MRLHSSVMVRPSRYIGTNCSFVVLRPPTLNGLSSLPQAIIQQPTSSPAGRGLCRKPIERERERERAGIRRRKGAVARASHLRQQSSFCFGTAGRGRDLFVTCHVMLLAAQEISGLLTLPAALSLSLSLSFRCHFAAILLSLIFRSPSNNQIT